MKHLITGIVLILIGLWGGAFAMTYFTTEAYELATLITSLALIASGVLLVSKFLDQ